MPKIRKKFIVTGIDESYYNIVNNIENAFTHQKINDDSDSSSLLLKSGVLASSKGKYLKRFNSEPGTLPSVLQTTGKTLQSYNDPFDETNILEYKSELSNSNVGIPLINLTELDTETNQQINVGHYITTNNDLLLSGTISKGDRHYISKYDLTNSKVFDSPNTFDNHIKHADLPETVKRQIKPDIDEILLAQKRFEEQYQPYKEDFSNFIIPEKNDEFYYDTIDEEILENYSLGRQRQIKIVLDFSSNSSVDLTLLNTKMTFNLPHEGTSYESDSYTEDDLISTKYINFLKGEQSAKSSYSSHFLPTAYWNFEKNRWNYLDGNLLDFDEEQENNLSLSDFPVTSSGDIKYSYLGAKNNTGSSTTISPNFIYNGASLQSQSIYDKNLKNNVLSVYNKPILTTPGFRPDGSTNANNTSGIYNKTGLSKITNTYGFPYKQNWQPTKDQLLNLSNYIANDFLLEKISIKGTFTSQGEMPNKKGNFSSGYRQYDGNKIVDSTTFNELYDYKDNFEDYITNSLTFFILNERKGFNHISQKINAEPLQSYFFTKNLNNLTQPLDYYNTKGKKLDSYLGSYSSYEIYQNTLNVYSQIIPNTFIYNIDEYNNVELNSSYFITSNDIQVKHNNKQNIFHFLENISDSSTNNNSIVDSIYIANKVTDAVSGEDRNIDWLHDYDLDVLENAHKKYNIKLENTEIESQSGSTISIDTNDFNNSTGRELVTYSNFLIVGKKSNINLDDQVLLNIDEKKIVNFETEEVNINITDKEEFKINSHVKNSYQSDYVDESIYKIKSNFKENVIFEQEQLSNLNISFFNRNLLGAIGSYPASGTVPLFEFSGNGEISDPLDRILGYPNSQYPDAYGIPTTTYDNLSQISDIDNKITSNASTCTYLNSKLDFKILDKTDGQMKDSSLLVFYSYQNNSAVNNLGHLSEDKSAIPGELLLSDFIVYDTIEFDGDLCTKVTLNLRFLDPFLTFGISEQFFNLGFEGSGSEGLFYDPSMLIDDVFEEYEFKLREDDDSLWVSTSKQFKIANFMKFFLISILNAPLYDKSSSLSTAQIISKLYKYIPQFPDNSNNLITISGEGVININFFESLFNPYTNNEDLNLNFYTINDTNSPHLGSYLNLNKAFKTFYNFSSDNRGASQISFEEEYYNYNNVLEGKSAGGPNNLGVSSERLFIRKKDKNTESILNPVRTISGKEIKSAGSLNFSENSNYLLKPEDRLVFGVSSNCNGEVAPTVVTLHDKLEITLIGRDYITNTKHKTNECKSIRKVVTGDNNTQRLGSSIYQTVGSYFDSVWSKNNSANNLKDFSTKFEVAKNSSRDFGTYTGVISFDKTFNANNEVVYQADTVQPSLAKVYLSEDCLNKKQLYSIDSRDRYQFNKKRENSLFKLPSYKMIFSDNISQENLTNYPNRYSKVETTWHSTFHMQKYKEFFQNSQNKKVVDYSYNNALIEKQDDKSNYFIYYDINSYSAGINYESARSLKKKYIENGNKNIVDNYIAGGGSDISSDVTVNKLPRLYKSLKTYMLPFSKHKVFQNALNIVNNSYTRKDKYIKNDKLIEKNVSNTEVFDIPTYSIQYMLHDIEPEYCDISDDVKYQLFGENNTEYSSSWCIVLKVSQIQFNSLRSKLSNDDLALFNSDIKTINLTSPNATVTYYNHNIFLNISEKTSDFENFEDIDLTKTVTKKFKFITKIYDNESANPREYYLVSPLHFWETSETNTLQSSQTNIFDLEVNSSTTNSAIGFGRKNSQFNISNKDSLPTSAWYAKIDNHNTLLDLAEASDVYENFLVLTNTQSHENTSIYPPESLTRKISITGIESTQSLGNFSPIAGTISADTLFVPFTTTELDELSESARSLIINKNILITYAGFNLVDKDETLTNTNVYGELSTLSSFLSNNFILNKTKKYLISNEYFSNQISLLQEKEKNSLTLVDENDLSYNINEKIYLSNCKNVISNQYFDTNSNFVYKIRENYIEGNNENNQESYKIIELKGITNSFTIFKKNKILEEDLLFEFNDNSKIRVYEEKLLKDVSTYSVTSNFNTPYFEIDLSSNLQREYSLPENIGENIKEIPYAHYSLDYTFNPQTINTGLNVEIQDVQESDVFNTDTDNISSGSPIFMLSENPDGYENKIEQEEKIKEFLYGFSRGKYRYPIKRLDGFKYGVECGSKKSFNYHFKNNSYGQFSDKIMGSTNYATARLDRQGNTVFDRAVEKRFVNEYFEFVNIDDYETNIRNNEEVYNKDRFCRSYYPYIENVNDDLSQLNSNNPYFSESNAF